MGGWSHYGGKPGGVVTIQAADGYERLDADVQDPSVSGFEIQEVYLHCDLWWKCGLCSAVTDNLRGHVQSAHPGERWWLSTPGGAIRIEYKRENGDDTGYQDFVPYVGQEDFLITHNHSEHGVAGQGGRWYIDVTGYGIAKVVITTRYSKDSGA